MSGEAVDWLTRKKFRQTSSEPSLRSFLAWEAACFFGTGIAFALAVIFGPPAPADHLKIENVLGPALFGALMGAILGPIPSLIVGYPVHRCLRDSGWTHPLAYICFGAIVAPAAAALLFAVFDFRVLTSGVMNREIAVWAVGGLFSGGVFWMIRRPDRDVSIDETREGGLSHERCIRHTIT